MWDDELVSVLRRRLIFELLAPPPVGDVLLGGAAPSETQRAQVPSLRIPLLRLLHVFAGCKGPGGGGERGGASLSQYTRQRSFTQQTQLDAKTLLFWYSIIFFYPLIRVPCSFFSRPRKTRTYANARLSSRVRLPSHCNICLAFTSRANGPGIHHTLSLEAYC